MTGHGQRLRVAIVAESFPPSVNGVARSVERVVDHLCRHGHDVLVVAPSPGDDDHHGVPVVRVPSVPLPLCPDFPIGLPTRLLRRSLQDFAPDVVHLASPTVLGAAGGVTASALGLPTVAVFQTDLAGFAAQYRLPALQRPIWSLLRSIHNHADRTLAPSRATIRDLRRADIRNLHRWGRGVDRAAFSPSHRTRPGPDGNATMRVGYVGRLATEKRVERLRHAAGLPGTELVVVGDGACRRRLESILPTATFTGRLGGDALSRAFADLDVFVHTGVNETFCQAAHEALAAGVPVVAPATGGLLDLVQHGHNGLLWRPDRPQDIRDAVVALRNDPAGRARMAAAARESTAGRTWDALGDELVVHYRAVLADRSTAPHTAIA